MAKIEELNVKDIKSVDELVSTLKEYNIKKDVVVKEYENMLGMYNALKGTNSEVNKLRAIRQTFYIILQKLTSKSGEKQIKVFVLGKHVSGDKNSKKIIEANEILNKGEAQDMYRMEGNKLQFKTKNGKWMDLVSWFNATVYGIYYEDDKPQGLVCLQTSKPDVIEKLNDLKNLSYYTINTVNSKVNDDSVLVANINDFVEAKEKTPDLKDIWKLLSKHVPDTMKITTQQAELITEKTKDFTKAYNNFAVMVAVVESMEASKNSDVLVLGDGSSSKERKLISAYVPKSLSILEKFGAGTEILILGSLFKPANEDTIKMSAYNVIESFDEVKVIPPIPKLKDEMLPNDKSVLDGKQSKEVDEDISGAF